MDSSLAQSQTIVQSASANQPQSFSVSVSFFDILGLIGIAAVLGAFIYIGRKLQILDDLKTAIDKVKINLKVVCDYLIGTDGAAFDSGKLQTYSPTQITAVGTQYLKDLGFVDIFKANENDFFDYIDSEEPKTDYDVEKVATRSISVLFNEDYFKPIKDYLYNHPKEDKNELIKVAGIYVRNSYQERQMRLLRDSKQSTIA